ncbi:Pycsar system effector family protein [Robiginitalea biformata]|uniref:Pycsar effector protein domain-containing protein n=1 Tax=Robiginitalea biformata (strain ATCC BAA-864 / DSM 15991 / KCTC 12146 / HTCC2501) TaxID=313596 RepID=A4CJN7_ROBBH|nr:Pycsar system effector family protein [Robiginitalea biformata]EAR17145.1 hypothetical protein RB2501_09585 [Robiginitalea biformata HTCC2501]
MKTDRLLPEDKLEVYWATIGYINGLNRTSEVKAGLIISFYGLLLGVVLEVATSVETGFNASAILIAILAGFTFFVCRSIFYSFRCFLPQIETKFDKNMFFFHDIITHYGDITSFSDRFADLLNDEKNLYGQLGAQIYVNSLIATKKFSDVNKSVRNLVYSFIPMILGVVTIVAEAILY